MENKKTTELLDFIDDFDRNEANKDEPDWDKYQEAYSELLTRTPFNKILGEGEYDEYTLEEKIDENIGNIKLLKRHKHDEKNGDVLIRI